MAISPSNIIQVLKTASGLILSQKNFAIYKQDTYEEGNSLLNQLGIDTNQILGGAFSEVEEVLNAPKFSESLLGIGGNTLSALASFVSECEPLSASFSDTSTIMQHPLERNIANNDTKAYKAIVNYVADHSIDNPREISVKIAFPRLFQKNIHTQLSQLKASKTLLVIVAKTDVYQRMVVSDFFHDEEPSTLERPIFQIKFREIQVKYPLENEAKDPENQSRN